MSLPTSELTSTPPATIQGLLTRLQAADALAGAAVLWGLRAELPDERERVYLLGVADFVRQPPSPAHRVRTETYNVRGLVEVHLLGINGPDLAAGRCWELLEGIDATLREDPDLESARYDHRLAVLSDEVVPMSDGWLARLVFRVGMFHNQ